MPQNCKENLSSTENKAASQDYCDLTRRPIHSSDGKDEQKEPTVTSMLYVKCTRSTSMMICKKYPDSEESIEEDVSENLNENATLNQSRATGDGSSFNVYVLITNHANLYYCFVPVFIVILLLMPYFYGIKTHEEKKIHISKLMDNMKNTFSQSIHTFRILESSLKPVVNESLEPSAPAVIILLAQAEAIETAWHFSEHLAELLNKERVLRIDTKMYENSNPEEIKKDIDDNLKVNLNANSLNVIMVDNLEKVPHEAALIFHSYCDHENAPFKRAVYLFVLLFNESVPEKSKHIDEAAMKRLRQIWHNAHPDLIESLITRITVSVVNIK